MTATYLVEPRAAFVAGRPPLWRWLLGGTAPLAALFLVHSGIAIGFPDHAFGWRYLPFSMTIPAALMLYSYFLNAYVLQQIDTAGLARRFAALIETLPLISTGLIGVSAAAMFVGVAVVAVFLLPASRFASPAAPLALAGIALVTVYGAAGRLAGSATVYMEAAICAPLSLEPPGIAAAHRRGGMLAAIILISGWAAPFGLEAGYLPVTMPGNAVLVPVTVTLASLPHLVMSWLALRSARPVPIASDAEFLLRLVATLFAIFALAAVEGVLLGNGI